MALASHESGRPRPKMATGSSARGEHRPGPTTVRCLEFLERILQADGGPVIEGAGVAIDASACT